MTEVVVLVLLVHRTRYLFTKDKYEDFKSSTNNDVALDRIVLTVFVMCVLFRYRSKRVNVRVYLAKRGEKEKGQKRWQKKKVVRIEKASKLFVKGPVRYTDVQPKTSTSSLVLSEQGRRDSES